MAKTKTTFSTPELVQLCEQAQRVKRLCDLMGFEFRGADALIQHLHPERPDWVGCPSLEDLTFEDPDTRPYIWDLTER